MSENPESSIRKKCPDAMVDLAVLTVIWLLSLAVVHPVGNFPLNDDWSYGLTTKHFLTTGDYRPTDWESMTLVANVIWGSLFCLPFGFSFDALRLSTLVASWFGILGMYWLMVQMNLSRRLRFLAALTFAFNPIYFALSNTFMTDVLFLTLMIFAAAFFLKDLNRASNANYFLGISFSIAAILSRQVGLAVPLAFAVVSIAKNGFRARAALRALTPLILCAAILILFERWLAATGRLPALYNLKNEELAQAIREPFKLGGIFAHSVYLCLMYLGLFLSPVLLWNHFKTSLPFKRQIFVFGIFLLMMTALTAVNAFCGKGATMPLATNLINKSGIGPLTLRDSFVTDTLPLLPNYFWLAVTAISLTGAAMLLTQIWVAFADWRFKIFPFKSSTDIALKYNALKFFLILIPVIYLPLFFVNGGFDRYLIPAVPFLIAGLSHDETLKSRLNLLRPAACLTLIGFWIFSVGGVHDYFSWNRARWQAIDELTQTQAVKPSNIDGGFEFCGYYLYRPDFKIAEGKYWWVEDDSYLLTFGTATNDNASNYHVFREYPYAHWMPLYTGKICVLKRNAASPVN